MEKTSKSGNIYMGISIIILAVSAFAYEMISQVVFPFFSADIEAHRLLNNIF